MQWLIFHVSWPPLSEVSGSATANITQIDILGSKLYIVDLILYAIVLPLFHIAIGLSSK